MEKIFEILEKNVQWIVLGLAVAFLGWVAYAYVYKPPAAVLLGTQMVLPPDVDVTTFNGPAKKLNEDMHRKTSSDFPTPDLVSSWRTHMQSPYSVVVNRSSWDSLTPVENLEGTQEQFIKVHVASLPILPKAIPLPPITGLSVVQLQAPAGAAGGNAILAQPAAAPATKDLVWNTAGFTIPGKLLAQAMVAPLNGQASDPTLYNSALLQVVLQRQKSIGVNANGNPAFPDGDKGVEEVPPLTINQADLQPLPKGNDALGVKFNFIMWALQNNVLIATPAFYTIDAGTPWAPPQNPTLGQPAPATQPGTQPADAPAAPAAPVPGAPKASASQYTSHANASYTVIDPTRPPVGVFPGNPAGPPPFANFGQPANGGPAGAQIDPFAVVDDIQLWAHDETVKPGQTYRYRVIYKMKNPIFGVQNMAAPALVDQLAIASPPSDWSPAVTVAETTKYWLSQIPRLDQPAKMDVAQWVNGSWTLKKNVPLGPGDGVPGTDMTLVDVRIADPKSGREKYVLLVSDMGDLKRRDLSGDVADPDHQSMLTQLAPVPAPGIAPPPPPGPRGRPIPGRAPASFR